MRISSWQIYLSKNCDDDSDMAQIIIKNDGAAKGGKTQTEGFISLSFGREVIFLWRNREEWFAN